MGSVLSCPPRLELWSVCSPAASNPPQLSSWEQMALLSASELLSFSVGENRGQGLLSRAPSCNPPQREVCGLHCSLNFWA